MSWLFKSLMPQSASGIAVFLFVSIGGLFACALFEVTHPDYPLYGAAILGTWLGMWCHDLHQFAGIHVVPRFASRMMRAYLVVLSSAGLIAVGIALANHDLFVIIGLFMATVVVFSILTLLVGNYGISAALIYVPFVVSTQTSDVDKGPIVSLLSSSYLTPASILLMFLGLSFLRSLLAEPIYIERRSLRMDFSKGLGKNFGEKFAAERGASGGIYGVSWTRHLLIAGIGILLSLAFLRFYDGSPDAIYIGWVLVVVSSSVGDIGRSIGLAPRAWLVGIVQSRAELSSVLLMRALGIAGIYTLAGLALTPITGLLGIELPEISESIFVAAYAGSALGLGLISSYSSYLERGAFTLESSLLLGALYLFVYLLVLVPIEFILGSAGVMTCAALYFLYRGHQRVTNLEFITA